MNNINNINNMNNIFTYQKGNCLISNKKIIKKGYKIFDEKLFVGIKLNKQQQQQEGQEELQELQEYLNKFQLITKNEMKTLKKFNYLNKRYYACILTIRIIEIIRNNKEYELYFQNNIFHNQEITIEKVSHNLIQDIQEIQRIIQYHFSSIILPVSINIIQYIDFVLRNTFTITDFELNSIGFGIYLQASKFNHSCEPNVFHHFDISTGEIFLQAIRDIKFGEELCISYIDVGQPTTFRRYELLDKYNFNCMCSKCCKIDLLDTWKCLQPKCNGFLSICLNYHKLIYYLWMNPTLIDSTPNDSPGTNWINYLLVRQIFTSQIYYPDTSSLLYLYSWIISSQSSNLLSFLQNYDLFFECTQCCHKYSIIDIIQVITEIYQMKMKIRILNQNDSKYINYQQNFYKLLTKKIPLSHYFIFDIGSILCLSFINHQRYEEALQLNLKLTTSLLHCYSFYSPIIVIQFYQIMKLYLFLGNELLAHKYHSCIILIMNVLYGETHQLTRLIVLGNL